MRVKQIIQLCLCAKPLRRSAPRCRTCGAKRKDSAAICADPLDFGCGRPTIQGLSLNGTPCNHVSDQPCQSCRVGRARADRAATGLPPWRAGAGQMGKL